MPGVPMSTAPGIAIIAIYVALAVIGVIGADLVLRRPERRKDGDRTPPAPLAEGVDPATLRRRPPRTQKLSGMVLIAAALVVLLALQPILKN